MDFGAWWSQAGAGLAAAWVGLEASPIGQALAQATGVLAPFADNPWVRTGALAVIVLATIWFIAGVYSGNAQGATHGPIGLKPHATSSKAGQVHLPRDILGAALDGVTADCEFYFVYLDRTGRERKRRLHTFRHATLKVPLTKPSATKTTTAYGHEVTNIADLPAQHVLIAAGDMLAQPNRIEPSGETIGSRMTPDLVESWRADDSADIIAVPESVWDSIQVARGQLFEAHVDKAQKAWGAGVAGALSRRVLAGAAPNVFGSYYVRFRFSRNPFFILTRHPDRDLKMTAWLTVLTSLFAMLMEAWPLNSDKGGPAAAARPETTPAVVRAPWPIAPPPTP